MWEGVESCGSECSSYLLSLLAPCHPGYCTRISLCCPTATRHSRPARPERALPPLLAAGWPPFREDVTLGVPGRRSVALPSVVSELAAGATATDGSLRRHLGPSQRDGSSEVILYKGGVL